MKISRAVRSTFVAYAAIALAGCGEAQPPLVAPGAISHTSWMLPEAKNDELLYASQDTQGVRVFSYPSGKPVGILNDADANGLCSDKKGDVFLTSQTGGGLTEYAHGGSEPIGYLIIPNGDNEVYGCAVDPATGNLAATFSCTVMSKCASTDEIAVFPNASGTPVEYGGSGLPQFLYCGYDDAGNLFLDGNPVYGDYLAELPAGSSTVMSFDLHERIYSLGQIQWDGKYVTMQDRGHASLYRLKFSGSTVSVVGTTKFDEGGRAGLSWIQGRNIVMPYRRAGVRASTLGIWKYPAGGTPAKTISKSGWGSAKFTSTTISAPTGQRLTTRGDAN